MQIFIYLGRNEFLGVLMLRKYLPFALLLALLLPWSFAQAPSDSFAVKTVPIVDKIGVTETASFEITISNGYEKEREFQIEKTGYPFWDMHTTPISNPITLIVPGKSERSIVLEVRPLHITVEDTYSVDTYVVDLSSGRRQLIPLTIGIKSTDALIQGYVPTVLATASVPSKIDPREPVKIALNLNNQNSLDYPNITIVLSSELINGEFSYSLGPQEEKRVEIFTSLDPNTRPLQDRLTIAGYRGAREIISPLTSDFSIMEYSTTDAAPSVSRLLRTQKTITISSNNPDYIGSYAEETTWFKNLFTSSRPKASMIEENGKRLLLISVDLAGKRSADIVIVQNFRPLVIIIVVLIILCSLYFVFRSPIVLVKEVGAVSIKEGGISEVKIIIRVKNRGKDTLSQIEVGDMVPSIAQVEKEMALGVMHPEKIIQQRQGTIVKWMVQELASNEGVVLSYRMKSRLTILGDFHLPSATARCKSGNSYVITNSNRVTVNN